MGRHLNAKQRDSNTKQINQFIDCVFTDHKTELSLASFIQINTNVSSELFCAVISVLEERLPCSEYYFRERTLYL